MRCSSAGVYAPGGSTFWVSRTVPVAVPSPASTWAGFPFTCSSATTKISPRAGSMTGVPVMPTVGPMSPQGSDDAGTGVARCLDQMTAPVLADSAYTVSFSVATNTRPPDTSGSPYSWPSSLGEVQAGELVSTAPGSVPAPEPAGSPWYTVQETVAGLAAGAATAAVPTQPAPATESAAAAVSKAARPGRRIAPAYRRAGR